MKDQLPSITIAIPTYNEAHNIQSCLDSIFSQNYPKKKLEVIVIDNYSSDNSVSIAKKYPVKIFMSSVYDAQRSKMIAFKQSKKDLFFYMDADLRLKSREYFRFMVKPLLEDKRIVGSFTRMYQIDGDNSLNRFLTHHPLQQDPIYEFFSPSIESTIVEKRKNYYVCMYTTDRIPAAGRCLYWRKRLLKTDISRGEKYTEVENLAILVESGENMFAYVPKAGEYHQHVTGIKQLIRKRLRNIRRNYLPAYENRKYLWFDLRKKKDLVKVIYWIIAAHLILPALIRGLFKAIKFKDISCIWYEPFLSIVLTDIILYGFLSHNRGWQLLARSVFNK